MREITRIFVKEFPHAPRIHRDEYTNHFHAA
jgi:hypothetical protein